MCNPVLFESGKHSGQSFYAQGTLAAESPLGRPCRSEKEFTRVFGTYSDSGTQLR